MPFNPFFWKKRFKMGSFDGRDECSCIQEGGLSYEIISTKTVDAGDADISMKGIFLVTKFEFGGSFGMSSEGDCHKVEFTPYFGLLVTFGMS
jgi:hypothetical protein